VGLSQELAREWTLVRGDEDIGMKAGEGGVEQTEERPAIGFIGFVSLCGRVMVKRDRHAPVVGAEVRWELVLGRCEDHPGEFLGRPSQSLDDEA
jgi:hypothetical protein